jgi:hypothetical protein
MPQTVIEHDKALFQSLLAAARAISPEIRAGQMFGCPAIYVGRRMVACVYGRAIGLKVPARLARENLDSGRATAFRPYGKPAMREWIQIEGGARRPP